MSDVGKIPGEKGSRPSEDAKRKKKPDSESFREMMKVGKVREVDPEEKRKRKSQAEAEEEFAEQQSAPPIHQGIEPQTPPPFFSEEGTQPQIGGIEKGSPQNLPPSTPSQSSSTETSPVPHEPERQEQVQQTAPKEKKKRKKGEAPAATDPKKKTKAKKVEVSKEKASKMKLKEAKPPETPIEEKKPEKLLETEKKSEKPLLPELKKEELKIEEPKKKEEEVAKQIEGIAEKPLPPGGWEASKEKEKKEEPSGPPVQVETQMPGTQTGAPPIETKAAPAPLAAPFAHLPPQIAQLFERMVGVMTVLHESGIKETTITLDNPQYAKSIFYGAQITISEYASAPKQFNIELSGNQQAVNLMGENAEELVAAFQAGRYNFKVNRIDLSLQRPTTEVRKKEAQRVKRKKTGGG